MSPLVSSPRVRRRLARLGVVAALCGGAAAVALLLPHTNGETDTTFSDEPVQRVVVEKQVPVTPRRRTEVNALFDAFVPAAVERRDPGRAYSLVTPAFRGGATREAWENGDLPVYPYEPRGATFHGWTVDTSFRRSMSVQLYLQPRNPKQGPVVFDVDLKRLRGEWRIDSFYPRASYAPTEVVTVGSTTTPRVAAPAVGEPRGRGGLMWILIVAFFSLVILVPVGLLAGPSLVARLRRRGP